MPVKIQNIRSHIVRHVAGCVKIPPAFGFGRGLKRLGHKTGLGNSPCPFYAIVIHCGIDAVTVCIFILFAEAVPVTGLRSRNDRSGTPENGRPSPALIVRQFRIPAHIRGEEPLPVSVKPLIFSGRFNLIGRRIAIRIVPLIQTDRNPLLLQIAGAGDRKGTFPRLVQCRQQNTRQNGDDRYYIDLKKLIS